MCQKVTKGSIYAYWSIADEQFGEKMYIDTDGRPYIHYEAEDSRFVHVMITARSCEPDFVASSTQDRYITTMYLQCTQDKNATVSFNGSKIKSSGDNIHVSSKHLKLDNSHFSPMVMP